MEWWVWPADADQYSIYLLGTSKSFWGDFWAAAFGALIGAGAAFALAWWEKQREERRRRVAAGNIALLTMYRMWYEIYNYEQHIIRNAVLKKDKAIPLWLRISLLARTPPDLRFDFPSLVFLLRSSEPVTLANTALQETRYHELFHAVALRNDVLQRVQESMAKKSVGVVTEPTDKELVYAIGIPAIAQLRTLTVGVFESVYKNLEEMRTAYNALLVLLAKELGTKDVVAFALEENFPRELDMPVAKWLGLLKIENNSRPSGPPF